MGMFNWVKLKIKCPVCGEKISGFQTKDGDLTCSEVDYFEINNFYSNCEKCGHWIEFNRKPATGILKDFDVSISDKFCGEPMIPIGGVVKIEVVDDKN
jgi:hypothetical protein